MAAATARIGHWRLRLSLSTEHQGGGLAAGSFPDADQVVRELYLTQYRSLVRLAVLLVGDVGTAEQIVQDSFVAMYAAWRRLRTPETALSYLHQELVRRSRVASRRAPAPGQRPAQAESPDPAAEPAAAESAAAAGAEAEAAEQFEPATEQFEPATAEQSAVLAAMRLLPHGQREAIVLLLYLGLPEDQAAAAMRISRRAVREHAARGRAALQGVF